VERLGDVELRLWAWGARVQEAMARGDYEESYRWAGRRFELVPTLSDPDQVSLIYVFGQPACIATNRFDEARAISEAHDEVTRTLTPHHRMHAAMLLVDVEERVGRWAAVRELTTLTESAVEANIATPCASNVGSLLSCALACVHLGEEAEARRLERAADEIGMEGYRFDGPKVELAIARGDLEEVERRLGSWSPEGFSDFEGLIARLNGLIALERRDEIEREGPPLLKPASYLEPFVLRALGFARSDTALIDEAIARFERIGMSWHAAQTRAFSSP
jgi:hypothetical protein